MAADNAAQLNTTLQNLKQSIDTLNNSVQTMGNQKRLVLQEGSGDKKKASTSYKDEFKSKAETILLTKTLADAGKVYKIMSANYVKSSKDSYLHSQVIASQFQKAVEKMSAQQMEDLPKKFNKILGKAYGDISDYGDVLRLQSRANEKNIRQAEEIWKMYDRGEKSFEKAEYELEKLGFTTADMTRNGGKLDDAIKTLKERAVPVNAAFAQIAKSSGGVSVAGFGLTKVLGLLMGAAFTAYEYLKDSAQAAAHFGTVMDPINATLMGMQGDQLAKLDAENRQAMTQGNMTMMQFNNNMEKSSWALLQMTGDLKLGAEVYAQNFATAHRLTSSQAEQTSFITEQTKVFETFYKNLSMTADQFNELNSSLINNADVQQNLFKLNEKQRVSYFQGLQQSYQVFRNEGLLADAAQRATEALAAIGAMSPKERLKQAARLQAVGGALGVGQQARELANIVIKGQRASPEEQARAAVLEQQINNAVSRSMSRNFNSELVTTALIEPLDNILKPFQATALSAGNKVTNKQNTEMGTQINERWGLVRHGVVFLGGIEQVLKTIGMDLRKSFGTVTTLLTTIAGLIASRGMLGSLGIGQGNSLGGGGSAAGGLGYGGRAMRGLKIGTAGGVLGGVLDYAATGDIKQAAGTTIGSVVGGVAGSLLDPFLGPFGTALGATLGGLAGGKLASMFSHNDNNDPAKTISGQLEDTQKRLAEQQKEGDTLNTKILADKLQELNDMLAQQYAQSYANDPTSQQTKELRATLEKQHKEAIAATKEQTQTIKDTADVKMIQTQGTRSALSFAH